MNRNIRPFYLALYCALALGLALVSSQSAFAAEGDPIPNWTGYQGYLSNPDGTPYNGTADLYFGLYDANTEGTKRWSEHHDGVEVSNGYFYVMLGGDDAPMGHWNYDGPMRYMEVRVCRTADCPTDGTGAGWETMPRQSMGAAPYAMQAHYAFSATHASTVDWGGIQNVPAGMGGGYKYYVSVAKEGGDYTSLYDAIQSVTDASAEKPYLIYVAPGVYEETQTIVAKPYVHIKGAGKYATIIKNNVTDKTLVLSSHVSISELTIRNDYPTGDSYAIYAHDGTYGATESVYLEKIKAYASYQGSSYQYDHFGIYLYGATVNVHLNYGYSHADYGVNNYGAYITNGASLYAKNSHFYGSYGQNAWGIYNTGSGSMLDAYYVKAWGRYAEDKNFGLSNVAQATAKLNKGTYYGKYGESYGTTCYGIYNVDATLEAKYVYGYGYECTNDNYGLYNKYDTYPTVATVKYSYFTGYKGYRAFGIYNTGYANGEAAKLHAYDSYGYGDESNYAEGQQNTGLSYGLLNSNQAQAWLYDSTFRGYKGYNCYGIVNNNAGGSTIDARSVEAYAKYCTQNNYGLYNSLGKLTVHGGTFYGKAETTGVEGQLCAGVYNRGYDNVYRGEYTGYDVNAWGDNCYSNVGIFNGAQAYATTYNGTYYGLNGYDSYGAYCRDLDSKLYFSESNLYGKDATQNNYGYYVTNGCYANIHGGAHYGQSGQHAYGGWCGSGEAALSTCRIAQSDVWAKDGAGINYGHYNGAAMTWLDVSTIKGYDKGNGTNDYAALYINDGDVYGGNSKWDGGYKYSGANPANLTCYGVYDGTYAAVSCPNGPLAQP